MGAGGWAGRLLEWRACGPQLLEAEISVARYFVRGDRHEVIAWAEVRDPCGRYRIDIGSFSSVGAAQAACERDAVARCRREGEERPAVDVRISAGRRARPGKAEKGRELPGGNYRPREAVVVERDACEALDLALAAFAEVIEDQG
jgi:hypothetical protein